MTIRLLPPASGPNTISFHGRSYTCAAGATIDVPDHDAYIMMANGWINGAGATGGTTGVTASRPVNPVRGQSFHDQTLNKTIVFDGKVWRDPATGSAV
jgi:hypothetical protein